MDYSKALPVLDGVVEDNVISTAYGLCILEIQGVLNYPKEVSEEAQFITVNDIHNAVKFGELIVDDTTSKVTLLVNNSQRLVGELQNLVTPLAVLRVPNNEKSITMIDVIKKKLIFNQRPLPIM